MWSDYICNLNMKFKYVIAYNWGKLMKTLSLKIKPLLTYAVFVISLGSVNVAYAEEYRQSGKTTCYTFKNDKLQKKASCTYQAISGYAGDVAAIYITFKMRGQKKDTTVDLTWVFDEVSYKLNDKEATQVLRQKANLKKATKAQMDKAFTDGQGVSEFVACVKDKSGHEFCYADGGIGTF